MRKKSNIYKPGQEESFWVSRSKIDLFLECPQCFYLDRRLGISRPDMPGWSLNSAVDVLFKKEFDKLREEKQPHRLMLFHRVQAVPFWHPDLHVWRDDGGKRTGASTLHKPTNLTVHGIIDDIWQSTANDELFIVDYKSTSTDYPISLDSKYKEGYKRQMEIYQWIFRQLGFPISNMGYFVFANAQKNREGFYGKLEFENSIIPYEGNDTWVEKTLGDIKQCLDSSNIPEAGKACQYCSWRNLIAKQNAKTQIALNF